MKAPKSWGEIVLDVATVLIVVAVVCYIINPRAPVSGKIVHGAQQTKQVNNVKQITLACHLFAADHAGAFPNGHYDPDLGKIYDPNPASNAEACFNDLIRSQKLEVEKVFWFPKNTTQCTPRSPDENYMLEPGENCWDYIAGLRNDSPAALPLAFEASDGGGGTKWTKAGGHPWKDIVIIGFVDGSAKKAPLNRSHGLPDHLCRPTPGSNGWPETARLVPATPNPARQIR